jgi:glycosyltransferase involved in cell wall biosynthesis
MDMNKQLTIVIPCKNEGKGIIKVLRLLQKQHLDCQIIIADSSDDETVELLNDYKSSSPQVIKIIKGGMPSIARNNGARLAKTPHILFLDADIYIRDHDLINQCLRVAIGGDFDLVTCKFHTVEHKYNKIYRAFDIVQWISSKTKPFAIGGFMLFKTETFNKLGGFNEEDKIAEDYHISSKIKPNKFKITDNIVYTPGRRFAKKGVYYMMKLAWSSWINRNNDNWFKKDYNYWK